MQSKPLAFLAAGALALVIAAGCSSNKDSDQSTTSTTTTTTESSPAAAPSGAATTSTSTTTTTTSTTMGDAAKGKQIFSANCATCHGATGTEGGVGPSLKGEKSRKNYQQTIAWIKNPTPPMPKLYPSPLSETDVENVAAYVQSL